MWETRVRIKKDGERVERKRESDIRVERGEQQFEGGIGNGEEWTREE